jgi:ribonuclease BN (tRNA processing enzyme)
MKIEILGCSGAVMRGFNTASILINGSLLVDAGSASSVLDEESVEEIRNIVITHSHIDHIKELPFIVDTLFTKKARGITIWGSAPTIEALKMHIFNGLIWPDMDELKIEEDFLTLRPIPQEGFQTGELRVQAFPVDHIEGSVCYVISEGGKHVLFSGDSGFDTRLFDLVKSLGDDLLALFVEVSFPDSMAEIAGVSRHLTPELVAKGLDGVVSSSTKVIAYHIKPKYLDEVVAQLPSGVDHIKGGEVFEL